ncbi:MAG: hypothetical protein ACYTFW_05425 [Planctomycetota bacterium]|jgi:hypothetical protein
MKRKIGFRNVKFSLPKYAGIISAVGCILLISEVCSTARSRLDICNREVQGWEACRQTNPSYFRASKEAVSRSEKSFDEARDNFWVKLPRAHLAGFFILAGLGSATGGYLATRAVLWFGGLGIRRFFGTACANQDRKRLPVNGVHIGDSERKRQRIGGLGKSRPVHVPDRHGRQEKQKETTRQLGKLHDQIKQLHCEITKSGETEVLLRQQIAKLMTVNEQSGHEVSSRKRAEKHPKQQANEVPVADEPFQRGRECPRRNYRCEDSHHVNVKVKQKLCSKCKQQKAESDFHKNRSCKDGLARWCKECKAKATREYRKKRLRAIL